MSGIVGHGHGVRQAEAVRVIAADRLRRGHPQTIVRIDVARRRVGAVFGQAGQGPLHPSALRIVDGQEVDRVQQDAPVARLQQLQAVSVGQVGGDVPEGVLVRVDGQAVDAGDPEPSARVAQQGPDLVVLRAQRVVRAVVLLEFVGVILVQPAEGAYPDVALRVFGEGVHLLVGNLVGQEGILVCCGGGSPAPGSGSAGAREHERQYRRTEASNQVFHEVRILVTRAKVTEKCVPEAVVRQFLNRTAIL